MKYQFGVSTTNRKEAEVFDDFKDAAKGYGSSHIRFLAHLMSLHYHWKAEGQPEISTEIEPATKTQTITDNLERMAIALEQLVQATQQKT